MIGFNKLKDYKQIYKNRGNSKFWIEKTLKAYNKYVNALSIKENKIVLNKNETLEDYLLKQGYKLKTKTH